ncbi:MAG: hypothetical protein L0H70_03010 [Xanthomonadales bacterium]|nr:hypothetical protein [Xanthomonadales bacterium]
MKLSEQPGRLVIHNPQVVHSAIAIVLAFAAIACVILGLINHIRWLYVLAAALLVIGAIVTFCAKPSRIVLTKSAAGSISYKGLLSCVTAQRFALTEAVSVHLVTSSTHRQDLSVGAHMASKVSASIHLHLRDGSHIALGSQTRLMHTESNDGALRQSMPLKKEAERIASFVGLPLQANDSSQHTRKRLNEHEMSSI